jgi:hypothetical protein
MSSHPGSWVPDAKAIFLLLCKAEHRKKHAWAQLYFRKHPQAYPGAYFNRHNLMPWAYFRIPLCQSFRPGHSCT